MKFAGRRGSCSYQNQRKRAEHRQRPLPLVTNMIFRPDARYKPYPRPSRCRHPCIRPRPRRPLNPQTLHQHIRPCPHTHDRPGTVRRRWWRWRRPPAPRALGPTLVWSLRGVTAHCGCGTSGAAPLCAWRGTRPSRCEHVRGFSCTAGVVRQGLYGGCCTVLRKCMHAWVWLH